MKQGIQESGIVQRTRLALNKKMSAFFPQAGPSSTPSPRTRAAGKAGFEAGQDRGDIPPHPTLQPEAGLLQGGSQLGCGQLLGPEKGQRRGQD